MRVGDISFLEIVKKNAIFVGEGITYYLTEIIFIWEFPGTWCICICICGQYSICQWCGLPRVLSDWSQNWFLRCSHCCCCHHCHHCHHCFCPGYRHHQNCYHIHRSHDSHHHYHNWSSHLLLYIKSTQSDQTTSTVNSLFCQQAPFHGHKSEHGNKCGFQRYICLEDSWLIGPDIIIIITPILVNEKAVSRECATDMWEF